MKDNDPLGLVLLSNFYVRWHRILSEIEIVIGNSLPLSNQGVRIGGKAATIQRVNRPSLDATNCSRKASMKVLSLDHVHVYCPDVETSVGFYKRHFEAEEVMRNENVHKQTRVFLSIGGSLVVLSPVPPGITPSDPPAAGDGAYTHGFGVAHFGFRVEDVESAVEDLSSRGVAVLGAPISESSGLTYAYIAGPDGVVIELTQYGQHAKN